MRAGLMAVALGVAVLAAPRTAVAAKSKDWVGSWTVDATVVTQNATFPALLTFFSDGNVIADETPSPLETSGHGSWAKTRPNEGIYTFVFLIGSTEPGHWTRGTVRGAINYEAKTDRWSGPFQIVVVDQAGQQVLSDTGTMSGQRITADGPTDTHKPIVQLVRAIDLSPQGVTSPIALAVDADQNAYVVDNTANPRVLKYDKRGRFVLAWGEKGSGPGQFEFLPPTPDDGPAAGFIAVDSRGYVYVSDAYNFRVQKFDANGHFVMQFGEPGTGDGQFDPPATGPIYIDRRDNVWVSTFPRAQKFDSQGHFLAAYGSAGAGPGQFSGAALGAIDDQGNLYIADLFNARVQKLNARGQFVKVWGTSGTADGQFAFPVGIVLDDEGRLYVSDNSNRIQVFTTDGRFIGKWTEPGKGYPPFSDFAGIAIDRKGDIYVAAGPTPAIYVFRAGPAED